MTIRPNQSKKAIIIEALLTAMTQRLPHRIESMSTMEVDPIVDLAMVEILRSKRESKCL